MQQCTSHVNAGTGNAVLLDPGNAGVDKVILFIFFRVMLFITPPLNLMGWVFSEPVIVNGQPSLKEKVKDDKRCQLLISYQLARSPINYHTVLKSWTHLPLFPQAH